MRVIAGKYKGRKLSAPKGNDIRPTTDKTKEAMFSILAFDLPGADVLDLFSGTGALGIEALSRGAASCVFCEKSRSAVEHIRDNLAHCGIGNEAGLRPGDVLRTLEMLEEKFDIVVMDPPYGEGLCEKAMEIIAANALLKDEGIIVCEHRKEDIIPNRIGDLIRTKERRYGISMLSIYVKDCGMDEKDGE